MAIFDAGDAADIPEGSFKIVDVTGRSIGVYNIKGDYYAIHNYCPHQGAKLCKGPICGTTLASGVYEYIYGKDREIVRCPWHGWEFDIKTGRSLFDGKVRTRSYPVRVDDGRIGIVIGEAEERKAE
jgi:3-phenylpropionate/trans-cinnamate dioxygenase ferredoxin subunit